MRNVSDKIRKENQNLRFVFNHFFFQKIMPFMRTWKNKVEQDRPHEII